MAAIALVRAGAQPILIDRYEVVGDAFCGVSSSWGTAKGSAGLGLDFPIIGLHR